MSASQETWRRAIALSRAGDVRHLLELLLQPIQVDSQGNALPDSFEPLPNDPTLRYDIVRALAFGPWRGQTNSIQDLWTRTGWGKTKPKISAFEAQAAGALIAAGAPSEAIDSLATSLKVKAETLRKHVQQSGRRKK